MTQGMASTVFILIVVIVFILIVVVIVLKKINDKLKELIEKNKDDK
jgi:predicted PurR-regulated permease PerM